MTSNFLQAFYFFSKFVCSFFLLGYCTHCSIYKITTSISIINELIIINKSLPSPWLSVISKGTYPYFFWVSKYSPPWIWLHDALLKVSSENGGQYAVANSTKFRPTKHNVRVVISWRAPRRHFWGLGRVRYGGLEALKERSPIPYADFWKQFPPGWNCKIRIDST